jgi:hypothetical protein
VTVSRRIVIAGWMLVAFLAGCAIDPSRSGKSRAVERVDLLLTSVAVDLDGKPGLDGFGARVYASNRRSSIGAVLTEGRLELLLFDGVVGAAEVTKTEPLKVWTYDANALKPFAQYTSIGTGYRFALGWGDRRPSRSRITIVARYVASDGFTVVSAPGTIPLMAE